MVTTAQQIIYKKYTRITFEQTKPTKPPRFSTNKSITIFDLTQLTNHKTRLGTFQVTCEFDLGKKSNNSVKSINSSNSVHFHA